MNLGKLLAIVETERTHLICKGSIIVRLDSRLVRFRSLYNIQKILLLQ